jgi:hypothetical protein
MPAHRISPLLRRFGERPRGAHGRRFTKTYPPTPNTTGIITNIPKNVLNIVLLDSPVSLND